MEQRRSAPTGRTTQTVAQQAGWPRCVGARGSHEGPEDQSGPSPSVCSAYAIARPPTSEEGVDGDASMDAQNAPTAAWNSRPEREIPTPPTAIIFFPNHTTGSERPGERSPDFYASTWLPTFGDCDHFLAFRTGAGHRFGHIRRMQCATSALARIDPGLLGRSEPPDSSAARARVE